MANIAGVESIKRLDGALVVGEDKLASCLPSDEVYSRKDVLEIIKRYDWFRMSFDTAYDAGDSKEDSVAYAKYFLETAYDGRYWEGVDDFMGDEE